MGVRGGRIGWAPFKTQDIQETRAKLATHRMSLMTACNLYGASRKPTAMSVPHRAHMTISRSPDRISTNSGVSSYSIRRDIHGGPTAPAEARSHARKQGHLKDWCGIETVWPMHLCQGQHQMHLTIYAAAGTKWCPTARDGVQQQRGFLLYEEAKELYSCSEEQVVVPDP